MRSVDLALTGNLFYLIEPSLVVCTLYLFLIFNDARLYIQVSLVWCGRTLFLCQLLFIKSFGGESSAYFADLP